MTNVKNGKVSLVAGAGGFIGGHLVKRLLDRGEEVIAVDRKAEVDWYQRHERATNLSRVDLNEQSSTWLTFRSFPKVNDVYMLACDMGGIGFIENNKLLCMLSVQMSTNMLRYAAENYVERFFYSSSACAYPVHLQSDAGDVTALSEDMAYPANSEDGYGWEKLFTERMARHFMDETGMETHVARYHNIYGTETSWNDGREKAPAAIARKVAEAVVYGYDYIDIWGDGTQSRSFCWIDDCLDGTMRLMDSDIYAPTNIGSDRLITVNDLVTMVEGIAGVKLQRNYQLEAPKGVAGRNSDNTFVRENLGWEPKVALEDGMEELYFWIYDRVVNNKRDGLTSTREVF